MLKCAKLIREAKKAAEVDNEFGISFVRKSGEPIEDAEVRADFPTIMERMRRLRSQIAPVDGHDRGTSMGAQTIQGKGVLVSPTEVEVVETGKSFGDASNPRLRFKNASSPREDDRASRRISRG